MKPTLLVLAAGMGSRYGGVKQIDAVGLHDETLLDFATFDAMNSGFGKVIYIIRRDIEKDFRERLFDRVAKNFDAEYIFQEPKACFTEEQIAKQVPRKKPWGTIHAVLCAEDKIKTPFAVINADDYYGRDGFATLGNYLAGLKNDDVSHAMVSYILKNTMSKNGTVSRGICNIKDGLLVSMQEHTKIGFEGSKIISQIDENKIELTGDEPVSMNFFGFTPRVFEGFHIYWNDFVEKNISSEKAEALLPVAASMVVTKGLGTIKAFTSKEKWFGMTYPEDREIVKSEIAKKIKDNYYPDKLWEK
ncbi:MAG: hypothetical protein GX297_10440 [Treponema sp.]|jgi:hypothetical protein|nr:hypothetical protein [Treponema sp.]